MHVLANSSPETNGYAIRSHMLLKHQANMDGFQIEAITSPWYPHRDSMIDDFESDGVTYHRVVHPARREQNSKLTHKIIKKFTKIKMKEEFENSGQQRKKKSIRRVFDFFYYGVLKIGRICLKPLRVPWKVLEEKVLMKYFEDSLVAKYKNQKIEIIHAHTPYRVGLPALKAARKLGIPFVYEMRGMWEETAVANGRWLNNGPAYKRFRKYETKVLRKSDGLICISEALKNEAISRGVNKDCITIVPNGISAKLMKTTTNRPDVSLSIL